MLVEFVLVVPILLVLLFAMVDFGKAFNYWIDETHLANQAARWAVVDKNPGPGATLQDSIEDRANTAELRDGGSSSTPVEVFVCFPDGTSEVGDPVRVIVSSTYSWLGFLVGEAGLPISTDMQGTATMRLEAEPTNYEPDGACP